MENVLDHTIHVKDPDIEHITSDDYETVYEPSDDTYLFMEAFERDLNTLRLLMPLSPRVLEMGPGTGILSTYLATLLKASTLLPDNKYCTKDPSTLNLSSSETSLPFSPRVIGLDINPRAVSITNETYKRNDIDGIAYESDIISGLPSTEQVSLEIGSENGDNMLSKSSDIESTTKKTPSLSQYFDIILWNPPYVPTPDIEVDNNDENKMLMNAYAGGIDGRQVLDRFLQYLPCILHSTHGIFYCLFMWPQNKYDEFYTLLSSYYPSDIIIAHTIRAKNHGSESLAIVRFMKKTLYDTLPDSYRHVYTITSDSSLKNYFHSIFYKPSAQQQQPQSSPSNDNNNNSIDHVTQEDSDTDDCDTGFSLF